MTKISKSPEEQTICFCPGCDKRSPGSAEEATGELGRTYLPCCNPKCQGEWGTGCYHCHHPQYWPHALYTVTAVLKGKKAKRHVRSFIRAETPGAAEVQFTEKLTKVLLVQHGCRWHIVVQAPHIEGAAGLGQDLRVVGHYNHFARGATIYHEPTKATGAETEPEPEAPADPLSVSFESFGPGETPEIKAEIVSDASPAEVAEALRQDGVEVTHSVPAKLTREEALDALRIYVSQQVEYEAIDIIADVIRELATSPGEHSAPFRRIKVQIGTIQTDHRYNEVLEHAQALDLGKLRRPDWLHRFEALIKEIREEFNLHEPVSRPTSRGQ